MRRRAEKITFVPVPQNFAQVLEERCQLLLDAQRAYSDTMRAYDAHWSAMAGYRVGQLYQELHEDLMAMPHPVAADTDARKQLFEGALRLRYSVLLDKALAMMEHTLAMASRTGEHSQWVLKAEEAKHQLEEAQKQENAAIDRLPYTRAELRRALEDLAKKRAHLAVTERKYRRTTGSLEAVRIVLDTPGPGATTRVRPGSLPARHIAEPKNGPGVAWGGVSPFPPKQAEVVIPGPQSNPLTDSNAGNHQGQGRWKQLTHRLSSSVAERCGARWRSSIGRAPVL